MAAARGASIRDMLPLVMPCLARKASSVLTSTSNSALPIPRTSYFASDIHSDPAARLRLRGKSASWSTENPVRGLSRQALHEQATVVLRPMIRSFLTVSTGTLASRLLGFARDSLIAALLGTGTVADAFLAAFQLVNVVRRLLTKGGLNAALVPAWLKVRETGGAIAAAAFAGRVLGSIAVILIVATALLA